MCRGDASRTDTFILKDTPMIVLTLTVPEVNTILNALNQAPYGVVAAVIANVRDQAVPQAQEIEAQNAAKEAATAAEPVEQTA